VLGSIVAAVCAAVGGWFLARGLRRGHRFGPADWVTLSRAVIACAVAGLVAGLVAGEGSRVLVVWLAAWALALDGVDGWVARRTGTASAFGARFDMEVDAFLILVLSIGAAPVVGWWALAIGLARYGFVAAGRLFAWLRGEAPPRPWCKVVAALQGIALTVAISGVLPTWGSVLVVGVALALLAESFGREAWDLRRAAGAPGEGRGELALAAVLAFALLWAMMVLPGRTGSWGPLALLSVPAEGLVFAALALVLGPGGRRVVAVLFGLWLALMGFLVVFDAGFRAVLDRPFDPVADWAYLGPGLGVLGDSIGSAGVVVAVVGVAMVGLALLVLVPWCAVRVARVVGEHRPTSARVVAVLGLVWAIGALSGLQVAGSPVSSWAAAEVAVDEVRQVRADLHDRDVFAQLVAQDAFAATPSDDLLTALRGKDVLLVFVESYGRVAVEGSTFAPGIERVLDRGTVRLRRAGYASRSAFLTSPTYGAASWLAHSTLQAGVWVDSQARYDQLLTMPRLTLTEAFSQAGWRTVFDVPANTRPWPEGERFYGYDELYDASNVGYAGPRFGYATMPDQYTLDAFRRHELLPAERAPVMAEVDLISSHHPWTPLPSLVPWADVGDGSVFDGMPEQGRSSAEVFDDADDVREVYGQSVEYTWEALVSYLTTYPDPDTVLIVLGDHQPHSYVSGDGAGHDVPISVIAQDPAVLAAVRDWQWQPGLHPSPAAPVWRMDTFRDTFLATFSTPVVK
jgi:phosphatidylglycerophosphate synthase